MLSKVLGRPRCSEIRICRAPFNCAAVGSDGPCRAHVTHAVIVEHRLLLPSSVGTHCFLLPSSLTLNQHLTESDKDTSFFTSPGRQTLVLFKLYYAKNI